MGNKSLVLLVAFTLALSTGRCENKSDKPASIKLAASVNLNIDVEKCHMLGITVAEVDKTVAEFLKDRTTYKLSELRSIRVPKEGKKTWALHEEV